MTSIAYQPQLRPVLPQVDGPKEYREERALIIRLDAAQPRRTDVRLTEQLTIRIPRHARKHLALLAAPRKIRSQQAAERS